MPTGDFPPPDGMKWTDAAGWVSASSVPTPMTGPVTTEALREALLHACFDPGAVVGPRGGLTTDEWRADACMKQLVPLLAAIQQVTAERDEADRRAGAAEREAERDREDARKRSAWLHQAKQQAGYSTNVSFDKVWAETLEKSARADAATSELARLRAEGEDLRAYAKKVGTTLVRLTCDGSEFYTRAGEDFRVDADACDAWVRRSRQSKHDMIVRLTKEISALRAEGEAKDRALKPFADLASSWVVQTAAQRDELLTLSNGERMCGIKATAFIDADTELARAATAREGA